MMPPKIVSFMRDSFISIVIGLLLFLLCEFGLRMFWPQTEQVVYVNHESLGVKDAQLGYRYRPKAKAQITGPEFSVEYEINADGMRDETKHTMPKPDRWTRILLLGDSFTFGIGSDYDKIWPVILERKLRDKGYSLDVVKAGAAALDTQTEVLNLTRLFPKYNPDIVVIAFLPNDLHTNAPLNDLDLLNAKVAAKENDVTMRALGDRTSSWHSVYLLKRLLMFNDSLYAKLFAMTVRKEFFTKPESALLTNQLQVTRELFLDALRYCRKQKADLIVLSIPQQFQVLFKANHYDFGNIDVDFIDDGFGRFAAENGFLWIPMFPELVSDYRSHRQDLYFRFDGHLTPRGNTLIGNALSEELERRYPDRLHKTARPSETGDTQKSL